MNLLRDEKATIEEVERKEIAEIEAEISGYEEEDAGGRYGRDQEMPLFVKGYLIIYWSIVAVSAICAILLVLVYNAPERYIMWARKDDPLDGWVIRVYKSCSRRCLRTAAGINLRMELRGRDWPGSPFDYPI